jgi:hypothetical protein
MFATDGAPIHTDGEIPSIRLFIGVHLRPIGGYFFSFSGKYFASFRTFGIDVDAMYGCIGFRRA